tara:strand:- start:83 stop:361 length:279 start_codon:yes stop_codon:yes gene_type:complete
MKKVLLGLVISVMMTGSGYAYEQNNWDRQNWSADLKEKSCEYVHFKSVSNLKTLYAGRMITEEFDENIEQIKEDALNEGLKYASLWSALCKD